MTTPFSLITRLRSWFFFRDRDITMQANCTITLGDGRVVDDDLDGVIPSGGVIFWPSTAGAIPANWTTFNAAAGRLLVGTSGSFPNGSTGGAETVDLQHSHAPGTLAASSEGHTHGNGTLAVDLDSHRHDPGTIALDNDTHSHGAGTVVWTNSDVKLEETAVPTGVSVDIYTHNHSATGSTADDTHGHTMSGTTFFDAHSHTTLSGGLASDSHSHTMSGSTATVLSSAQSILPPYLVGTWIQKT